ncbi:MAG: hypothetical protein AAF938_26715, partial [Myxococcota bacterium]
MLFRDDDLRRTADYLANRAEARLTIVGPPGCGKSALVALLRDRFRAEGDVVHIDAAGARTVEDVLALMADERAHLSEAFLVIVDNVEHVHEAVANEVNAHPARWLFGSRRPLGVDGEMVHELAYLPCTGADSPAYRLFVERARAQRLSFAEDESERVIAASIVERLGGCPLAIEMAAAHAASTSAAAVAAELERSGSASLRSASQRFTSLDACVRASWELLTPEARTDLAALACLRGSFDLASAELVLGAEPGDGWVRLQVLRAASLIQMDQRHAERFFVNRVVRDFVTEYAPHALSAEAEARLTAHYLRPTWNVSAFESSDLPSNVGVLRELFDRHLGAGRVADALQALLRLRTHYLWFSDYGEYASMLESLEDDGLCASLARSEFEGWRGRFRPALVQEERAVGLAREEGPQAEAIAEAMLGHLYGNLHEGDRGLALLATAASRLAGKNLPTTMTFVLRKTAQVLLLQDETVAEQRLEFALAMLPADVGSGRRRQILIMLAIARLIRGDGESAAATLDEVDSLGDVGSDEWPVPTLLRAVLTHVDGGPAEARPVYERCQRAFADAGNPRLSALCSLLIGNVRLELDEPGAEEAYVRALQDSRPRGERAITAMALAGRASLKARAGERDAARVLLDEAEALAATTAHEAFRDAIALRRIELGPFEDVAAIRERLRGNSELRGHITRRFACRLVEARLRRALGDSERLTVHRSGSWFERGGAERVDLSRRRRPAALLARLAAGGWVPL